MFCFLSWAYASDGRPQTCLGKGNPKPPKTPAKVAVTHDAFFPSSISLDNLCPVTQPLKGRWSCPWNSSLWQQDPCSRVVLDSLRFRHENGQHKQTLWLWPVFSTHPGFIFTSEIKIIAFHPPSQDPSDENFPKSNDQSGTSIYLSLPRLARRTHSHPEAPGSLKDFLEFGSKEKWMSNRWVGRPSVNPTWNSWALDNTWPLHMPFPFKDFKELKSNHSIRFSLIRWPHVLESLANPLPWPPPGHRSFNQSSQKELRLKL